MREKLKELRGLLIFYQANVILDNEINNRYDINVVGRQKIKTLYK